MDTPHEALEVLFCDLCNTSVPLQDVHAGNAVRHQGKTVGSCCLPALREAARPAAATPGLAARAGAGEGRMLTLGIVLLVAVAAAALFLDSRIGQSEARGAEGQSQLADALRAQGDVIQSISLGLDGKAERAQLQELARSVDGLLAAHAEHGLVWKSVASEIASIAKAQSDFERALTIREKNRPDHGPVLAELQQQLRQQAVTLAEILARPRPAPAAAEMEVAPVMPPEGLPPEVAHQVARLQDRDEGVRFEAVDDLLKRREPKALPHLLPLIKDPDTFVRRIVAEGLKDFAVPEAVDALLVALADPEEIVRDSAWRSLKELTRQSLPFEAAGTRDARARQQQKWQEWWDKSRATFGG